MHKRKVHGRHSARPLKTQKKELYTSLLPELTYTGLNAEQKETFLEIGFGGGEHLAQQAEKKPSSFFIGCEPFVNGVASLLKHINDRGLENIRIFDNDVHLLLESINQPEVFDGVYLLFADPWPKKRHYKRRFVQDDTINRIHSLLKKDACWYIATDHEDYRQWILEKFDQHKHLFTQIRQDIYLRPSSTDWPITRYEQKAIDENRPCGYMIYKKI